jgi:hypothetical protein
MYDSNLDVSKSSVDASQVDPPSHNDRVRNIFRTKTNNQNSRLLGIQSLNSAFEYLNNSNRVSDEELSLERPGQY